MTGDGITFPDTFELAMKRGSIRQDSRVVIAMPPPSSSSSSPPKTEKPPARKMAPTTMPAVTINAPTTNQRNVQLLLLSAFRTARPLSSSPTNLLMREVFSVRSFFGCDIFGAFTYKDLEGMFLCLVSLMPSTFDAGLVEGAKDLLVPLEHRFYIHCAMGGTSARIVHLPVERDNIMTLKRM